MSTKKSLAERIQNLLEKILHGPMAVVDVAELEGEAHSDVMQRRAQEAAEAPNG
jgi:hypothetical protein